jgi:hypothetical protein
VGALNSLDLTSQSTARTTIATISPHATAALPAAAGFDPAASGMGWRAGATDTGRSIVSDAAQTHASATIVVAFRSSNFATNLENC